jgi:hypothetical protein
MSELIQCVLDSGFSRKELEEYLPTGQKLTADTVDAAIDNLKRKQSKLSADNIKAQEANIRLATRVEPMMRPVSEGGMGMKPREVVKSMLVRDLRDRSNHLSVSGLALGYQAAFNMPLAQAAEKLRPTLTGGMRDKNLMFDAFEVAGGGKAASNDAATLGAAIRKSLNKAHKLLTEAGGQAGFIPDYIPQTHVAGKLRKAGATPAAARAKWKADVVTRLDRTKMTDFDGNQLNDAALDELLDFVFQSITTEGRNKIKPPVELRTGPGVSAGGMLERVLHFKSVDDALWYAEAYGNSDLWGTLTNHLHGMAIDAAVHKVFGPQPERVYSNWRDWANKADQFNDATDIDHIWRNVVGFNTSGETKISHVANSLRDIMSSAYMGAAMISSINDVVLTSMNASMNGMNVPRMLSRVRSYANAGDRELLSRTAGNIDYALSTIAASQRFEETVGRGLTHRLADANYRVSGMTGWMNSLRHAWLTEFQTMLAGHFDKSFKQLPREVSGFLETYGLDGRWDDLRKMKTQTLYNTKVADFSSLDDEDLMVEILGAVYSERDLGILTPDGRTRALLNQGKAPGGFVGEMFRAGTQFKTFPATMVMHGVWRYVMSRRLGSFQNRLAWSATMFAGMTILGGVSYQLREMAKGRDPRPMNTMDFFARAVAQGGAVPGLAELWLDGQTHVNKGVIETLAGPSGSAAITMSDMAIGAAGMALGIDDSQERFGKAVESATYMVPGNTLWYGRAAIQREIRDAFMDLADPNYAQRQRQSERNRRNMFDQDMWWGYGDNPEPPEFEGLLGD